MNAKVAALEFRGIELDVVRDAIAGDGQVYGEEALEMARGSLSDLRRLEAAEELTLDLGDVVLARVAGSMARRYGLDVYRRPKMSESKLIVLGPPTFVDTVYWPVVDRMPTRLGQMFVDFSASFLEEIGVALPSK